VTEEKNFFGYSTSKKLAEETHDAKPKHFFGQLRKRRKTARENGVVQNGEEKEKV
jgi:hypothetical protein